MELKQFIESFSAQFDDTDRSEFDSETVFKDLNEWSSLLALSIIAMLDEEYNIRIKGEDIRRASTVKNLFDIITGKE